jgi:hypothetical protein
MSTQAPLSSFRIRPRFEQVVSQSPAAVREQILVSLRQHSPELVVKDFPGFIGIHLPDQDRRNWSPRLFLSLDPAPQGGTKIEGIYGPEIEIWSVFLYGYIATGMLGTFAGILGGAQLFIESYPWGFWVCGGMAFIALLLYLFAQLGQKFGAWQTFRLHQAYQTALGSSAERE